MKTSIAIKVDTKDVVDALEQIDGHIHGAEDHQFFDAVRDAGNVLANSCYGASFAAGWWSNLQTGQPFDMGEVRARVPEKLCLIHSEVSEALEGHRKSKMDDHLPYRQAIEVELADAVIRIADLAGALNLDLGGAIAEKMRYNAQRADHKIENRRAEGGKSI